MGERGVKEGGGEGGAESCGTLYCCKKWGGEGRWWHLRDRQDGVYDL